MEKDRNYTNLPRNWAVKCTNCQFIQEHVLPALCFLEPKAAGWQGESGTSYYGICLDSEYSSGRNQKGKTFCNIESELNANVKKLSFDEFLAYLKTEKQLPIFN